MENKLSTESIKWCIEECEWTSDCSVEIAKKELSSLIARVQELERENAELKVRIQVHEANAVSCCDGVSECDVIEQARREGYEFGLHEAEHAEDCGHSIKESPTYEEAIAARDEAKKLDGI
jgi:hypothetical protein